MDLMTKFKWFKTGVVQRNTSVLLQKFFKTEPTEEQLLLLDKLDRQETMVAIICLVIMFIYGAVVGIALLLPYVF